MNSDLHDHDSGLAAPPRFNAVAIEHPEAITLPPLTGPRRWPHLVVLDYPVAGETFRLVQPETIIGRSDEADIRPFHRRVSRQHARLIVKGDRVLIEDLGSSNGTFVDGEPITTQRWLTEGDVIVLAGATALRLTYSTILDGALRPHGYAGSELGLMSDPTGTASFFNRVRIHQVRARMFGSQFTLALLRVDGPPRSHRILGGEGLPPSEAIQVVSTTIRDALPTEQAMARISANEIVVLARVSAEQMVLTVDHARLAAEAVTTPMSFAEVPGATVTAAILPVPMSEVMAPETILCAAGDLCRSAIAGETNRVVALSMLDVRWFETMKTEAGGS